MRMHLFKPRYKRKEINLKLSIQRRVKPHTFRPSATFEDMVIHKLNIILIGRLFLIKNLKTFYVK